MGGGRETDEGKEEKERKRGGGEREEEGKKDNNELEKLYLLTAGGAVRSGSDAAPTVSTGASRAALIFLILSSCSLHRGGSHLGSEESVDFGSDESAD